MADVVDLLQFILGRRIYTDGRPTSFWHLLTPGFRRVGSRAGVGDLHEKGPSSSSHSCSEITGSPLQPRGADSAAHVPGFDQIITVTSVRVRRRIVLVPKIFLGLALISDRSCLAYLETMRTEADASTELR